MLLPNGFTADDLDAHFDAWEAAAIHANGGSLEDDPWTHVSAYLETIGERDLDLVLIRRWASAHPATSFYAFHNIVYSVGAYMRDGVPSQGEIDAPIKDKNRALNGHLRPPKGCFFCAGVHGARCPEKEFTRDLCRLGYAHERASPPEWPLEPFPEEVAAEEAYEEKKRGPSSKTAASKTAVDGSNEAGSSKSSANGAGSSKSSANEAGSSKSSAHLTNIQTGDLPPVPPARFVICGPTTVVKDRHLLVNLKRIPLPVVSVSPFMQPAEPYIVARAMGTLVLRPQGAEPIQIDNVLYAPECAHNVLGVDVLLSDLWNIEAGVLTHAPTGASLPLQLATLPACVLHA
ncbi:uncharacterized protein LOC62_06G008039 [Vanrija pseudolonga]|uniref:Uncharacterized protein n=1 Tax=Vanrija pseudolonga TaxID=143232 RepID=A0AAF1BL01_9TREE|nr:hypothetical protein LOC62_06G008039 [Vanrija pseudolonga]